MQARPLVVFMLPVALLAACVTTSVGGSTGGGDQPPVIDSLADYQTLGDALIDASANLGFTEPSTLPTTGSATYDGVMGLVVDPDSAAPVSTFGTLEMQLLFASNDISGRVTNIVDDDDQAYQGSLTIDNGDIDRGADLATEFTYFADVGGTITDSDGDSLTVDAILGGDLLGPGTYTEGIVEGFVVTDTGTTTVEGGFIGERRE